jgi:signal transduction histidine kinase
MVREISRRMNENGQLTIDDLRMRTSELALAYRQLAEQEMARRRYLTYIANELRAPLLAAGSYVQLIQRKAVSPKNLNVALDTISRQVGQISALINDILFLQEMDLILGKFQQVDMNEIVRDVVDKYTERAKKKSVQLRYEPDPILPPVLGDSRHLRSALTSLVENAVKFSPRGGKVVVRLRKDGEHLAVSVSDESVGLPPDTMSHVFDRFYHLERGGDEVFESSGLGLAIAKQIIEQHNGRLELSSQPDQGSTFTIWLNVWNEEPESQPPL